MKKNWPTCYARRAINEQLGITGMLLYKNNEFMQALEGRESAVAYLAHRISRDPRHREVRIILNTPAKNREFPDWTMGFRNLGHPEAQHIEGYSTFLESPLRSAILTSNPSLCRDFLMLFKTKPARTAISQRGQAC